MHVGNEIDGVAAYNASEVPEVRKLANESTLGTYFSSLETGEVVNGGGQDISVGSESLPKRSSRIQRLMLAGAAALGILAVAQPAAAHDNGIREQVNGQIQYEKSRVINDTRAAATNMLLNVIGGAVQRATGLPVGQTTPVPIPGAQVPPVVVYGDGAPPAIYGSQMPPPGAVVHGGRESNERIHIEQEVSNLRTQLEYQKAQAEDSYNRAIQTHSRLEADPSNTNLKRQYAAEYNAYEQTIAQEKLTINQLSDAQARLRATP
jgi:hypothetical protein